MNFGLLKASIDVSNDRLEKAVAQALGHTVSGGVTGATHDVAEYLQANNGLSVKNPMNQQMLKNHLKKMKVDVDSLLNKTKVVFKGGVDRSGRGNGSNGFSVGPMPTDKDVSDMITEINTLRSRYDITDLVKQIESEIDELQQSGGNVNLIQWWEDMRTDVLNSKNIIDDAIRISQQAATGFGQAKSETLIKQAEIKRLQNDLAAEQHNFSALKKQAMADAANAKAALAAHAKNSSSGNASAVRGNMDQLNKIDAELKASKARIAVLENRIKVSLNSVKEKQRKVLEDKFSLDDEKDEKVRQERIMYAKFERTADTWWKGYPLEYLPQDLEDWIRKEKAVANKIPVSNFLKDGMRVYNVGTSARMPGQKIKYLDHTRYELKTPPAKATKENPAPLNARQKDDADVNFLLENFTPRIEKGDAAPSQVVTDWYYKYANRAGPMTPDPKMEVYYLGAGITGAFSSWANTKLWSVRRKPDAAEIAAQKAASEAEEAAQARASAARQAQFKSQQRAIAAARAIDDAKNEADRIAATQAQQAAEAEAETARKEQEAAEAAQKLAQEQLEASRLQQEKDAAAAKEKIRIDNEVAAAQAGSVAPDDSAVSSAVAYMTTLKGANAATKKTISPSRDQLQRTYAQFLKNGKDESSNIADTTGAFGNNFIKNQAVVKNVVSALFNTGDNSQSNSGVLYAINPSGETVGVTMTNATQDPVNALSATCYAAFDDLFASGQNRMSVSELYTMICHVLHSIGLSDDNGNLVISSSQTLVGNANASFEGSPFSSMFLWM